MLTGDPPLGYRYSEMAFAELLERTLPESVSREAKRFIKAALTWLVLLIAGIKSRLFSYKMDVKKIMFESM